MKNPKSEIRSPKPRGPALRHSPWAILLLLSTLGFQLSTRAQGTAFTYQGRLDSGGGPASGIYDLRFAIYDLPGGGSAVAGPLTHSLTAVTNGLFTVTLDFGAGIFTGADRWLEINVRTNGGGAFSALSPRQKFTATPYAVTAGNVVSGGLAGSYGGAVTFNNAANSFNGSFTGNGAGLAGLNASQLASGTVPDARLDANVARTSQVWLLGGNAGTTPGAQFLGTTDLQPLEFRAGNLRALRLEPNTNGSPNLIGGASINFAAANVIGGTIGGGGVVNSFGFTASNRISDDYATIGGGIGNYIEGGSDYGVIGGGRGNFMSTGNRGGVIGGGYSNQLIQATAGSPITANVIAGGRENVMDNICNQSVISGGEKNQMLSQCSHAVIGGGDRNQMDFSNFSVIAGGQTNEIHFRAFQAVISGGQGNSISTNSSHAVIGGGFRNMVPTNAPFAVISGGSNNVAGGAFAVVPGGGRNEASGDFSFAAGRRAKATNDGAFVWADAQNADFGSTSSNQFLIRASGGVGIGTNNPASALHVNGDVTLGPGSQLLAGGGSNGAPGISFAGDSNTGIVHPFGNTITFVTGGAERLRLESGGFVCIGTNNPIERLHVLGNILATGTITPNSDRNAKAEFEPVDTAAILKRVATLPIQRWRFKAEEPGVKHVGPMAQDFHAAFGLGAVPTAIATVDADGVALAAIQGLNEKLEARSAKGEGRIQQLEAENSELKARLEKLEQLVGKLIKE